MATPVLSTIHHVTERKLDKLARQQDLYLAKKAAILKNVAAASDPRSRVEALLEGFNKYGIQVPGSEVLISNLELFLKQGKHDSSVSARLYENWQAKLEKELQAGSAKYEHATLFGKLVLEWIKYPNPATATQAENGFDSDLETSEPFDEIGRKEMHEQRKQWESYAFTERKVDQRKIEEYLNEIFDTTSHTDKVKKSPLRELRDSMKRVMPFKSDIQKAKEDDNELSIITPCTFTIDHLKSCIRGVLNTDLFEGEKRAALADLENHPAVLKELVDVLNMDLDSLETWEWDPSPVPLTMRRQLNGKYRVYMDEEAHQAILLHFIGMQWASKMKDAFTTFYHSGAWLQTPFHSMSQKARRRREYFVPRSTNEQSTVRNARRKIYQKEYFMTQLPDNALDDHRDYATEDQDETALQENQETGKSPAATKQAMLRLMTTELLLNTKVYGEFVVVQSDFKWFGPSLPHDTLFAVLKFLGVTENWMNFFKKFLEAPVRFTQDGEGAEAQIRKCGIPMSHVLSDALSEAVLFCLDFAVNKRTGGSNIYRFHDDLWVWGQEKTCIQAWSATQEFTKVMGLALNEEKTGTALITSDPGKTRSLHAALPKGEVRWGFLRLDAQAGRWLIDRAQVDEHIEEVKRQLGACRSIMAWVQAWNSYVCRFFSSNFGEPANCFGREHNDMIIETYAHIQKSLFETESVTEHLRAVLKERFGVDDSIPDGFFYFPFELGGLNLRNPFINPLRTYRTSLKNPSDRIKKAFEEEQEEYERLKERWEAGETHPDRKSIYTSRDDNLAGSEIDDSFMDLEEYTRYREEVSMPLQSAYMNLMSSSQPHSVQLPDGVSKEMPKHRKDRGYWIWIYSLYAGDLEQRFGQKGLQLAPRDLLPVGMMEVLRSEKVRWVG